MKLQLGYLAANVLADWSIMRVEFEFESEVVSKDFTVEVYRYSDNSLVDTLVPDRNYQTGFWTSFLTNYDRTGMYFKLIAPSVRLTMRITSS